jgi:D-alanyl-D-alanine carboxypeptidase
MKKPTIVFAFALILLAGISAKAQTHIDIAELDKLFSALEANDRMMGSVTLTQNGKVIYERALGYRSISEEGRIRSNAETEFRIGSITKVYTAVMIWQLIEEKKLTLDTKLSRFFPQIENADRISIAHLLSHTSGLHDYASGVSYDPNDPKAWIFYPQTSGQMLDRLGALKPDFAPGEKEQYSNTNYTLLGYLIESITDSTYGRQLEKRIIRKIGLKRTRYDGGIVAGNNEAASFVWDDGKWNKNYEQELNVAGGAGGIVSTPRELAKFINALADHKLINAKSLNQMTAPVSDKFPDSALGLSRFKLPGIDKFALSKQGGIDAFTSDVVYVPEDKFAFALTINGHNYPMAKIFWLVMDICYHRPVEIPTFQPIELAAEKLQSYEGVFELKGSGVAITVKKDRAGLSAQATAQDSFPLAAIAPTTFADRISGIIIEFSQNPDGSIRQFTLYQGRNVSVWAKKP